MTRKILGFSLAERRICEQTRRLTVYNVSFFIKNLAAISQLFEFFPEFICSKLEVLAITRDKDGNNHGRLLEFADSDGNVKHWILPMEMFDELHGFSSGKEFSEKLDSASRTFYGVAGQAFLEMLLNNFEKLFESVKSTYNNFVQRNFPKGADGQVGRVLNRFAIVATAGALASKFGITGWPLEASLEATLVCFHGWLNLRGGIEALEEAAILAQVRLFFEKHGSSRFFPFDAPSADIKTINRAGFRRYGSFGEEFYMFTENFKQELCIGADQSYVAEVCIKHGLLMPGSDGKATRSERLPGECRNIRCYRFTSKVLGLDENVEKEDEVPA